MNWLAIVLEGVSAVAKQWVTAGEEERKQIEENAMSATSQMLTQLALTGQDHDRRVLDVVEAIRKARAAQ